MKKLTVLWLGLLFYPVISIISNQISIFNKITAGDLILLGMSEAVLFFGYFIRFLLYKNEFKHKHISHIAESAIGLGAAITADIVMYDSEVIVLSVLFIVLYFIGIAIYSISYQRLVTSAFICISSVIYIAALIMLQTPVSSALFLKYCIVFVISIYIYLLLHNQKSIDNLMTIRNYDIKYLPKETRMYNIRLVGIVCLIISSILLLRKQISGLIFLIIRFFAKAIGAVLDLISKIIGDDDPIIPNNQKTPDENDYILSGQSSPYANTILLLIFIIFTSVIIFIKRKKIIQYFKALVFDIINFVRNIFSNNEQVQRKDYGKGYIDFYETVKSSSIGDQKLSYKQQVQLWKKNFRKFSSMPDDNKKFRFGYGLALSGIRLTGTDTKISDTPNEIAVKTGNQQFVISTDEYNHIRYGNNICNDKSITDISNILKEISEKI